MTMDDKEIMERLNGKVGYRLFYFIIGIIATVIVALTTYVSTVNSNFNKNLVETSSRLASIETQLANQSALLKAQSESIASINSLFSGYNFKFNK